MKNAFQMSTSKPDIGATVLKYVTSIDFEKVYWQISIGYK